MPNSPDPPAPPQPGYAAPDAAQQRRYRTVAAALFAVIALALLLRTGRDRKEAPGGVQTRTGQMREAATVLGRHLGTVCKGGRILLLTDPRDSGDYRAALVDAAEAGLRTGVDGNCSIGAIAGPTFSSAYLPPPSADSPVRFSSKVKWLPSVDEWFLADALTAAAQDHPDCDVIVSMIGLPIDDQLPALQRTADGGPGRLAVLAGALGRAERVQAYVEDGILAGAMVWLHEETQWLNTTGLADVPMDEALPFCVLLKPDNVHKFLIEPNAMP